MLFEELPCELLIEIFSYIHPADLYISFIPLLNSRLSYVISNLDYSLDLTRISFSKFSIILTYFSPYQIRFLRLTNQYSHSLLISEFFSSKKFHPNQFIHLRSLHLDDVIGNEINSLPPYLEKLYIKFHKKAEYATKLYQIALQSTTLKQCYLIGGYAFDTTTCSHISSTTIQQLHMAIKNFPNDLIVLLQSLPNLIKLKTRVYNQSSGKHISSSFTSPLVHLNIDLHGNNVNLSALDSQLLTHLPQLQSLIYHSYGKSNDMKHLIILSKRLKRIQFIRKGLSVVNNIIYEDFNTDLVYAVQENSNNKNSRQSLILHTIPYPDNILQLPFIQWNKISINSNHDESIYDRVKRIRINLSELSSNSNIPLCRHANHLTLFSTTEMNHSHISVHDLSSMICLSSIRHLIINSKISYFDFHQLFSFMSLDSLDICWSQLYPDCKLLNIKNLCLISECVSWEDIDYLINRLIPKLEHLQMNVTTSDKCRQILDILLSPKEKNNLISIKICICQTLSDQIKQDLQPLLLSSQWIQVKWRMDNWYLYIWK